MKKMNQILTLLLIASAIMATLILIFNIINSSFSVKNYQGEIVDNYEELTRVQTILDKYLASYQENIIDNLHQMQRIFIRKPNYDIISEYINDIYSHVYIHQLEKDKKDFFKVVYSIDYNEKEQNTIYLKMDKKKMTFVIYEDSMLELLN